MTVQPALRLVHDDTPECDSLPMERRTSHRYSVSGRVTAVSSDLTQEGLRNRICSLQLLNMSDGGLGAIVQEPLDLSTPLAIFFPPHGPERGFDLFGHVVRCISRGWGYEIGIRFEARAAA